MPAPDPSPGYEAILFFDGYCGLCDRFVSRVLADSQAGRFRFSPLQGETFRSVLERHPHLARIDSMVVLEPRADGERLHLRSDASRFILARLSGSGPMCARLLGRVPHPMRDWGYRCVAAVRYRVFGTRQTCRVPTEKERLLFLP